MGDIYIAFSDGKNKYYDNFDVKIRNGIPNEKLVIGRVVIPNPRLIRGDYPFDIDNDTISADEIVLYAI